MLCCLPFETEAAAAFLADRINGRAIGRLLRRSIVCLSVCL